MIFNIEVSPNITEHRSLDGLICQLTPFLILVTDLFLRVLCPILAILISNFDIYTILLTEVSCDKSLIIR